MAARYRATQSVLDLCAEHGIRAGGLPRPLSHPENALVLRFYSRGEGNYQQMPKRERLQMFINLEPVCEIDIRASYLAILHAWADAPFDPRQDPYDILGLGSELRELSKAWIVASFGNEAPITKWTRELRARFLEATGRNIPKRLSANFVGAKIMAQHPVLGHLGKTVDGRKAGWAELMHAESRAMFSTMLELKGLGIPSLSMHDSIIVPILKHHVALRLLRKNYRAVTNANPVLVSHAPQGHRLLVPRDNDGYNLIADNDS